MKLSKFLTTAAMLSFAPATMAAGLSQDTTVTNDLFFSIRNNTAYSENTARNVITDNPLNFNSKMTKADVGLESNTGSQGKTMKPYNDASNDFVQSTLQKKNAILNIGDTGDVFAATMVGKSDQTSKNLYRNQIQKSDFDSQWGTVILTRFDPDGNVKKTNTIAMNHQNDTTSKSVMYSYKVDSTGSYAYAMLESTAPWWASSKARFTHGDGTVYNATNRGSGSTAQDGAIGSMVVKIDLNTLRVVNHIYIQSTNSYSETMRLTMGKDDKIHISGKPHAGFHNLSCAAAHYILTFDKDLANPSCSTTTGAAWFGTGMASSSRPLPDGRIAFGMSMTSNGGTNYWSANGNYKIQRNIDATYNQMGVSSVMLAKPDFSSKTGVVWGHKSIKNFTWPNPRNSGDKTEIVDIVFDKNNEWMYVLMNSATKIDTTAWNGTEWDQARGERDVYLSKFKINMLDGNEAESATTIKGINLGGAREDKSRSMVYDDVTGEIVISMETKSADGPVGSKIAGKVDNAKNDVAIVRIDGDTLDTTTMQVDHLDVSGTNEFPEITANQHGVYVWWMNHNGGNDVRINGGTGTWDAVLGKYNSVKRAELNFYAGPDAKGYSEAQLMPSWRPKPASVAEFYQYTNVDDDPNTLEGYLDYLAWKAEWLLDGEINNIAGAFNVTPSSIRATASNREELIEYINVLNAQRGTNYELPELEHEPIPTATHLGSNLNWAIIGLGGSLAIAYIALMILNKKNKEENA